MYIFFTSCRRNNKSHPMVERLLNGVHRVANQHRRLLFKCSERVSNYFPETVMTLSLSRLGILFKY